MKFPLFDFEGAFAEKAGTFDKCGARRIALPICAISSVGRAADS